MYRYTVAVIGSGYVGLTTGACLASLGHRVRCADIDSAKVDRLRRGEVDILEPGLPELIRQGQASGLLAFEVGSAGAVRDAEVVILCLPTPMGPDGTADLTAVSAVLAETGALLAPGCVLVNKSTVPVGTARGMAEILGRDDVHVVSNPEFLREGSAVADFLSPDRIVVGSDSRRAAERVLALYARLGAPAVLTDATSAELVKYAANCFLATKLSYVNSIAELSERLGGNIADILTGMGYDQRIGQSYLRPGPGWGGSCLPKDTMALLRVSESVGFDFPLLAEAVRTNERQRERVVDRVEAACGGSLDGLRLGLLGLTFKAGTDDLRDSPALAIAELLVRRGAELVAHDPAVAVTREIPGDAVAVTDDPYQAAKGADGLVLLTEWPSFRALDWSRVAGLLARPVVVDTRNHLDPDVLAGAGITLTGFGAAPGAARAEPDLVPEP
ncbi:UDP-glucose dehydrogenase family protein [Actinoalloteichus caeruleus]|uniref:UDP-glucose 6-dehydrogenase n=1 Tax=Actinoalloteichus caeruleus DSM 43889 TaxID=1120930 RepID=A0ABT1JEN8_ACTCY|nr:UDP-glucose/GDP-mannose dehydrogenase family protein [Actinoalloteichus caeruleus]MCP2330951.1 UDPglucose 6-dehydrogenase [Actinoalloteichus caeruleus DSM 43889]